MQGKNTKVEGTTVTIETASAATAREIAAAAENEVLLKEGGFFGFAQTAIDVVSHGLNGVAERLGRSTFEIIASALMVVGGLIAFISWSRLLPIKSEELNFAIGLVGVGIVVGTKVCAGRWAKECNERDAASAEFWRNWVIAGVIIDGLAALAFSAAVVEDEKTGRIDYDVQIESLEREAKQIGFRADELDRPNATVEILEMDLGQLLNQTARNREGTSTGKPVKDWIGWGTESYCITTGNNTFYVDRYCADIIDADRKLKKRQAYEAELARAQAKADEAAALRAARPERSSGAALGKALGDEADVPVLRMIVPMALMFVILLVMVTAAFIAKRDPKTLPPKPQEG